MRAFQVFAAMTPERTAALLEAIGKVSPAIVLRTVQVAAASINARPKFLQQQPFLKRAAAVRRSLSRVTADALAEEILAVYFLECRKEILTEWLDALGIAHEEGVLKDNVLPQPPEKEVQAKAKAFLDKDDVEDRRLLLQAFAAQSAIDWPALEDFLND